MNNAGSAVDPGIGLGVRCGSPPGGSSAPVREDSPGPYLGDGGGSGSRTSHCLRLCKGYGVRRWCNDRGTRIDGV